MLVSGDGRRFRLPTPFGGDEEDRTPDPLLARQVLSQLSYTPMYQSWIDCRDFGISFFSFPLFEGSQSFLIAPSKLNNDQVLCSL